MLFKQGDSGPQGPGPGSRWWEQRAARVAQRGRNPFQDKAEAEHPEKTNKPWLSPREGSLLQGLWGFY